jgi:nitrate reductase alpha subunit
MHPFIHPLSAAVDPVWESRSDWDIYKGIRQEILELAPGIWVSSRMWCWFPSSTIRPEKSRSRLM